MPEKSDRLTLDPDAVLPIAVLLTAEEVGALLLELDHAYVRRPALRSALQKLNAAYPELCTYCHSDSRSGTHRMARCFDTDGKPIQRENAE